MISHVRVRVINELCHGLMDVNGLWVCEGLIDDESCPCKEEVNGRAGRYAVPALVPSFNSDKGIQH